MTQRPKHLLAVLAVVMLLSLPLPLLADQLTGKIASVSTVKREFVVTENFKNWTFQLTRDAKVSLNGRRSRWPRCRQAMKQSSPLPAKGNGFLPAPFAACGNSNKSQ